MDIDDSFHYETTYTQDERIENQIKEQREKETIMAKEVELKRATKYQDYYNKFMHVESSVFNSPGMRFIKFTSQKIKFAFHPYLIARLVSPRLIFYVSLSYRQQYKYWAIKGDSIPVNYKSKVYTMFYKENLGDNRFDIISKISEIGTILKEWAREEHKLREDKIKQYHYGIDVHFDEDDQELFLSESQVKFIHRKREEIWTRMLPPKSRLRSRRQQKLKGGNTGNQ